MIYLRLCEKCRLIKQEPTQGPFWVEPTKSEAAVHPPTPAYKCHFCKTKVTTSFSAFNAPWVLKQFKIYRMTQLLLGDECE